MSNIEVLFYMPSQIETGLALGAYERIGGVIRDTQTKQVVMWLQEGRHITQNPNATKGVVSSILHKVGMSSAGTSAIMAGAVPMLNLALAGYTLYLMIERVRELENEIEEIHERVSKEFMRDRRIELEAALANALDVVEAENDVYKQQAAHGAIDKLFKSQKQRLTDFDQLIAQASEIDELQQMQNYLLQAMLTTTMRARCYLETNQINMARSRLNAEIKEYLPRTKHIIRKLLGQYPAMYFNGSISDEDFERYLKIEAWLREADNVLPILVREYRSQFWNKEIIKPLPSPSFNPFRSSDSNDEASHLKALTQAEIVIENYHRLLGFELELASMRLSFEEWDGLTNNITIKEDYVLLVDTDLLDASDRLSL